MLNLFSTEFSGDKEEVDLYIETGDRTAEIFIFDAKLNLIERAVGEIFTKKLPPGIYKVRVRTGSAFQERLVDLLDTKRKKTVTFKPLKFASPIPLANTAEIHEFHVDSAAQNSQTTTVETGGSGSAIYLFARYWTAKKPVKSNRSEQLHPARGLTLHDETGHLLVNIELESVAGNLDWEPWAACNISVNPGFYRLRLELADGSQIEQPVIAAPDWRTQIFLLQHDYGNEETPDLRPDLNGAAIIMQRLKEKFDASDPSLRFDEQARLGLMNQRSFIYDSIRTEFLKQKSVNPMLGIYGAHLLLTKENKEKPDFDFLELVVSNLREIMGDFKFPDVEALALSLPNAPRTDFVFDLPPMLRRSWAIVVEKTINQPELVPTDSLSDRICTRIWGVEPFLMWLEKPSRAVISKQQTHSDQSVFTKQLKQQYFTELPLQAESNLNRINQKISRDSSGFSEIASPANPQITLLETLFPLREMSAESHHLPELVQQLGLPRSTVERLVANLIANDTAEKTLE